MHHPEPRAVNPAKSPCRLLERNFTSSIGLNTSVTISSFVLFLVYRQRKRNVTPFHINALSGACAPDRLVTVLR
jgi:hypothetical protein